MRRTRALRGPGGRAFGPLLLLALAVPAACHRGSEPAPSSSGALSASQAAAAGFLPHGIPYESGDPCRRVRDRRIPAGSGCAFLVQGDLDGDRRSDMVLSYATLGPDGRARSWHLRAVLASGPASTVEVQEPYQLEVVAAEDLDADGRQEALVRVDQGASTSFFGIYTLDGRRHLVPVTEDGRAPLRFGVNGSVTHGDGGGCVTGPDGKPRLVIRSAESVDGATFESVEKTYAWNGTTVHLAGTRTGTIEGPGTSGQLPPDLQAYYQFTCGSFHLS